MSANNASMIVIFNPSTRQFVQTQKLSYFELTSKAKEISLDDMALTEALQDIGGHSNHDDGFYTNFLILQGFCLMRYFSAVVTFEGASQKNLSEVIDGVFYSKTRLIPVHDKIRICVIIKDGKGFTKSNNMCFSPEVALYSLVNNYGGDRSDLSIQAQRAIGSEKDIRRKATSEKLLSKYPSLAKYKRKEAITPPIIIPEPDNMAI